MASAGLTSCLPATSHGLRSRQPASFTTSTRAPQRSYLQCKTRRTQPLAALGGGQDDDKKFITRDEEPDQFWQTKTEKKGQNPAKDPLALIGILGLLLPFIILGIAIGTGVVDVGAGSSAGAGVPK